MHSAPSEEPAISSGPSSKSWLQHYQNAVPAIAIDIDIAVDIAIDMSDGTTTTAASRPPYKAPNFRYDANATSFPTRRELPAIEGAPEGA